MYILKTAVLTYVLRCYLLPAICNSRTLPSISLPDRLDLTLTFFSHFGHKGSGRAIRTYSCSVHLRQVLEYNNERVMGSALPNVESCKVVLTFKSMKYTGITIKKKPFFFSTSLNYRKYPRP